MASSLCLMLGQGLCAVEVLCYPVVVLLFKNICAGLCKVNISTTNSIWLGDSGNYSPKANFSKTFKVVVNFD